MTKAIGSNATKASILAPVNCALVLVVALGLSGLLSSNIKLRMLVLSSSSTFMEEGLESDDDSSYNFCHRNLPKSKPSVQLNNHRFGVSDWTRNHSKALLLKKDPVYGQTGNQIREFFHAFDMARDENATIMIAEDGFPMDMIRQLFLGFDISRSDWRKRVEALFGVTFLDSNNSSITDNRDVSVISTGALFWYKSKQATLEQRKAHRHYIIRQLFQMTVDEMIKDPTSEASFDMCSSIRTFLDNTTHNVPIAANEYTVVHSRFFEDARYTFLEKASAKMGVDNRASIDLPPKLFTDVLTPLGMHNKSILMITDGQNSIVSDRLSLDPTIGPYFRVAPRNSSLVGDIMLAITAKVFLGNPASTLSWFIAQTRYALGLDHSYLFVRKSNGGENEGHYETFCDEDCLYSYDSFHWA